jgi:hypothetical protein
MVIDKPGCGEGYLVEDASVARRIVLDFTKKGYRGVYLFKGSPHFFIESIFSLRMDGISLRTITHEMVTLLREERSILLFDGASFLAEEEGDALKFFCLLKDQALVSGSCFILYVENTPERWHTFLERELVRVV